MEFLDLPMDCLYDRVFVTYDVGYAKFSKWLMKPEKNVLLQNIAYINVGKGNNLWKKRLYRTAQIVHRGKR